MTIPYVQLHSVEELRALAKQLHRHADLINTTALDLGDHHNPILQAAEGLEQLLDRLALRRQVETDDLCEGCAAWEKQAWEATSQLRAITEQRDQAITALQNIRLLACRSRHEQWGKRVMRFCGEGGVRDPLLQHADSKPVATAEALRPDNGTRRALR